jgi:hypothetical protein
MPSSPPFTLRSWLKPALRFCGSCAATLVCWAVWLAFGATLIVLIYVAVARELPVPDFVLRRVEARLAEANLVIKFGRARFDPTGRVLLEDVQLHSRRFEEPLLTSRLVFVRRSIWSILAGRPVPDEIRLEGAALQLPAMLSPSGTAEPLLRDLAVVLRHEENLWHLDTLTGRIGQLAVTAQGDITPPSRAGGPPLSLEEIATRFLQIGRRLVLEVHQFDAFDEPALSVRLDNPPGVGNTATVLFTAKAARQPWKQPLTLGPLALTATLRLDGKGERTLRLHAATRDAVYRGDCAVDNLRAIISAQVVPEELSARPVEVLVAAGRLTVQSESALGPVLRADLADWPAGVRATVATQINGEFLAAEVEASLHEQSARLRAAGRGSPEFINRVLARHTPRAASYFVFGDPVDFTAEASLTAGWHFDRLSSRVAAGRLDSHGVKIDAARGRIDIVGMSFLAYDARVAMGENEARGSYWMDFATTDYRMLLTGRLRPPDINGWFRGDWWLGFWNDHFAFPATPPEGDVDVSGRWREVGRSEFFGRAEATGPVVLGAAFARARTLIFLRPHFTHALELGARRAGGAQQLDGWFKRIADPAGRETQRVEFRLDSSLDAETYRKMGGEKAETALTGLQFAQPPRVHAEGALEAGGAGFAPRLTFTGVAEGGLRFYGFPVDSARATGGMTGDEFRLDDIQFTVAGGQGGGKAALGGTPDARRLGFDVHVSDADLARSIRAVEEFQAARTGQKGESATESKFIKRASGGRLAVSLAAQGRPGDLASFTGTGKAALTGTELGEIHLFGLLSQVLSGLSLNFSSLKLDAAHTSFKLEAGRLQFPDLKITGRNALIDARGDFTFATNALDFTARFKPYEENRNLLTATLGMMINPITSFLELKLTGPLSKPDWSVVVGQSAPKAEPGPPLAPTTPPPPATPPAK